MTLKKSVAEKKREKSIGKILSNSIELFSKNGYKSTSVSQIAKRCKISKSLIYNYFKSKEEILLNIVDHLFEMANSVVFDLEKVKDPVEKLEIIISKSFEFLRHDKEFTVMYVSLMMQPEVNGIVKSRLKKTYKKWSGIITKILIDLKIKDAEYESYLFLALIDGLQLQYMYDVEGIDINKITSELTNRYLNMGAK